MRKTLLVRVNGVTVISPWVSGQSWWNLNPHCCLDNMTPPTKGTLTLAGAVAKSREAGSGQHQSSIFRRSRVMVTTQL